MKHTIIICLFSLLLFSCSEKDNRIIGKYETEYVIYYGVGNIDKKIIYTNNEVYTCSYQGTNFLIEKNNPEEIYSTTAPIKIKYSSKILK